MTATSLFAGHVKNEVLHDPCWPCDSRTKSMVSSYSCSALSGGLVVRSSQSSVWRSSRA